MAKFDKPRAIQIIDNRFRSSTGRERTDYFDILKQLDPEGQPERVVYAMPLEPDEIRRTYYVPFYKSIAEGLHTRRYLESFFVRFMAERMSIDSMRRKTRTFLNEFIPIAPPDSVSRLKILDSLISYKHQVASFDWVRNASFVTELDSHLTRARTLLLSGDSVNTYREIRIFQQKVDTAYQDSLSPTRGVNREGWKFLHYNAGFILAGLPQPPAQFDLTVNVVGSGSVTKKPDQALFDSGASVTLTAAPTNSNYRFKQWSGSITGTINPVTVTMNGHKKVTATFVRRQNGKKGE